MADEHKKPDYQDNNGSNVPQRIPEDPVTSNAEYQELRKARNLVYIGLLLIVVAIFFIGGLLFSSIGLICSIVSLRKCSRLVRDNQTLKSTVSKFRIMSIVGIVLGIAVVIFYAVTIYLILPEVMQAYESGDLSTLFPETGSLGDGQGGNSTWG